MKTPFEHQAYPAFRCVYFASEKVEKEKIPIFVMLTIINSFSDIAKHSVIKRVNFIFIVNAQRRERCFNIFFANSLLQFGSLILEDGIKYAVYFFIFP